MNKIALITLISFAAIISSCSKKNSDLAIIIKDRVAKSTTSLIPNTAGVTPSYWCTWSAQNFGVDTATFNYMIGMGDHSMACDKLTEEAVFGQNGWEKKFPGSIKKDLFIVFDLGWDISGGCFKDRKKWVLGTHNLASDKFPSCTGTPTEKLQKLNELTRKAGWKGTGIWVAAQTSTDSKEKKVTDKEVESYLRERLMWSKNAGIEYWKVDYGIRNPDLNFREKISRLAHEIYPELWVEHGRSGAPFNDEECPWDSKNFKKTGSFKTWDEGKPLKTTHDILEFSDVLRTYDVSSQMSIPTTLDRVAQIMASFTSPPHSKGIINCEDEPYMAASLGCAIGIMRHPAFIESSGHDYDPLFTKNKIDALIRAVRWQRLSPAFSVGLGITTLDSTLNNDYWKFKPGQTWASWMNGKTVLQTAPKRVSRGMEMADISSSGLSPYVMCTKFPNGNYAVGTMCRADSIEEFIHPLADIVLNCDKIATLGIFGMFKSLTISFSPESTIKHIFAQDLAGNKAIEITDLVKIKGATVKLSGQLINLVGLSSSALNDKSEPGLALFFR